MDFYNFFTGRPNPGRTAPTPVSRYLSDTERVPSTEATPHRQRREVAPGSPAVPVVRTPPARVYRYGPNQSGVPISVAAGQSEEPFGNDFAAWYNEGLDRGYTSESPPPAEPENPGRTPMFENNIPLGVEGGRRNIPTRLEMGATDHAPTVEQEFAPIQSTWDPARRAGIMPDHDPTREWAAAEERANERWRSGRPSPADMIFAAVFGNRGGRSRNENELQQMRDEVRQR